MFPRSAWEREGRSRLFEERMSMEPLPIDAVLPELIAALRLNSSVVLQAPTGAGKTTRVPPAILDAEIGRAHV